MAKKQKVKPEATKSFRYFCDQYKIIKKRPYNCSPKKEMMLFHYICSRFPLTWVLGMIDFYLQWDDPFIKDCGYTIGVFYSQINRMLEMNIHKSEWVKKHENKSGFKSAAELLPGIKRGD